MASLRRCAAILLLAAMCAFVREGEARATPQSTHYDAVVVEFAPRGRANADPALQVIAGNWAAYEKIIDENKGADVVVFPEVGLTGMEVPQQRQELRPLLSRVPDADVRPRPVPCDTPAPLRPTVSDVVRNASCAARRNEVYLVVNLPEEAPCAGERGCPPDGFYIYNTNMVFDRTGTLIIRYRKTHLYVEHGFNSGREGQRPVFESDFGVRFGTFICFDIMYEDPPLRVVREMGATDILHNSAWYSAPPFYTANQVQGNWAHTTNVTLLSSGLNRPQGGQTGSGIYWGDRGAMKSVLQRQFGTTVLRVRVPKRPATRPGPIPGPAPGPKPPTPFDPQSLTLSPPPDIESHIGQLRLFRGDLRAWTTQLLPPAGGAFNSTLCHGAVCCRVEALTEAAPPTATSRAQRYYYRAAVFDGMMDVARLTALGEQACGVVACLDAENLLTCGGVEVQRVAGLRFKRLSVRVSGFQRTASLQEPSTLAAETLLPLPAAAFRFRKSASEGKASISTTKPLDASLLTFAVHGRVFSRDRPFEDALPPNV